MHIKLSPVRSDTPATLIVAGDVLTYNGEDLDLSEIPEGATLPRSAIDCDWAASDVCRIDGELHLAVILPHGANAANETRFPEPIHVTTDGPVDLPEYDVLPELIEELEE